MKMKRIVGAALAVMLLVAGTALPSQAMDRWHDGRHDFGHQRHARFEHHPGHFWHWGASAYLFAPAPVYVAPPAPVYEQPQSYWYFCDYWQAYYPYVTDCPSGWRAVAP